MYTQTQGKNKIMQVSLKEKLNSQNIFIVNIMSGGEGAVNYVNWTVIIFDGGKFQSNQQA